MTGKSDDDKTDSQPGAVDKEKVISAYNDYINEYFENAKIKRITHIIKWSHK